MQSSRSRRQDAGCFHLCRGFNYSHRQPLRERRHRGLARRLVAVCGVSGLMLAGRVSTSAKITWRSPRPPPRARRLRWWAMVSSFSTAPSARRLAPVIRATSTPSASFRERRHRNLASACGPHGDRRRTSKAMAGLSARPRPSFGRASSASTSKSSLFHAPDEWKAEARLRTRDDMANWVNRSLETGAAPVANWAPNQVPAGRAQGDFRGTLSAQRAW